MDKLIALARLEDAQSVILSLLPDRDVLQDSKLGRVYGQITGMAADLKKGRLVQEEIVCAYRYAHIILNDAFLYNDRYDRRDAIVSVEDELERVLNALFYAR